MALRSFVQRFTKNKNEGSGNSIQQEIMLEDMSQAQEDLASLVSRNSSSTDNVEVILSQNSKNLAPDINGFEEQELEQDIEEHSTVKLLRAVELATSTEELTALTQRYEARLDNWNKKVSSLRSEKHLKEYLSVRAALTMLQSAMKNAELVKGKPLSDTLQTSLKTQQQLISDQTKQLQVQQSKIHEQKDLLASRLSTMQKSLEITANALKKDPGKLKNQDILNNLRQLQ